MAKKNYEILSQSGINTFLTHGNVLMSVDTFYDKLVALHNKKNKTKINKRILDTYYDVWYDLLVNDYKQDFIDTFNKVVNIRYLKAVSSYEVDCIIIERVGDCR